MRRPSRPHLLIGAATLAVIGAVAGVLVTSGGSSGPHPPRGSTDRQVRIPVGGGVTLSAEVITPKGTGPAPLVVMPASWGSADTEYQALGDQLAGAGMVVVAYAQPGFGGSGGVVDFGGTPTQLAASKVIDWALGHTRADPKRIGMAGVSYGAGISLLVAARDPRIRAVVAMSTWTDLAASFHANDTIAVYSLGGLISEAAKSGHLDAEWTRIAATLASDPAAGAAQLDAASPSRSPSSMIGALNRNRPAIMIANALEDSIFPPQQLVSFYDRLTGPKRLQLAPGDHGAPEYAGLLGRPDQTTATARAWLAHYLLGTANGIDKQPPIQLQDVVTGTWHTYRAWPADTTVQLSRPDGSDGMSAGAAQSWSTPAAAGTDTVATSGLPTVAQAYRPPTITLSQLDTQHAWLWTGPAVTTPTVLCGTPRLQVDVRSSNGSASLFAYLYDVDPNGQAALIEATPYTTTSALSATPVAFDLQPMSWTFAAGHRLALVIDTVDPRWHSASTPGSTVTLSSSGSDPATLSVPLQG